jgi:hypothetical protein
MIEFVMSRVWLVIAGLAVAGVVVLSFTGLDDGARDKVAVDGANTLGGLIEELQNNGQTGEVRVDGQDILFDDDHTLRVCNGSIWVQSGSREHAIDGPRDLVLVEGHRDVDGLTIQRSDQIILRSFMVNGQIVVQLEKVDATSLTASTNSLHSSSVLYR